MASDQIQFVYFDLDDTLLDHQFAERQGLADVYSYYAEAFSHVSAHAVQHTYHRLNVVLWKDYADKKLTKEQLKEARFDRLFKALDVTGLDGRDVNDRYLEFYARYWRFIESARPVFIKISDHFPVGILTNGFREIQQAKREQFVDLSERVEAFIISDEVGYMKPHLQLFKKATSHAGVAPGQILYVGDSYHSDVLGGLNAGWQVAWYTKENPSPQRVDGVFQFSNWDRLLEWLLPESP